MHYENIKTGDVLVVTKISIPNKQVADQIIYNGVPWTVVSMSFPFILCRFRDQHCPFDTRKTSFSKSSKQYRRKYEESNVFHDVSPSLSREDDVEEYDLQVGSVCPRCKEDRLVRGIFADQQILVCRNCNFFDKDECYESQSPS